MPAWSLRTTLARPTQPRFQARESLKSVGVAPSRSAATTLSPATPRSMPARCKSVTVVRRDPWSPMSAAAHWSLIAAIRLPMGGCSRGRPLPSSVQAPSPSPATTPTQVPPPSVPARCKSVPVARRDPWAPILLTMPTWPLTAAIPPATPAQSQAQATSPSLGQAPSPSAAPTPTPAPPPSVPAPCKSVPVVIAAGSVIHPLSLTMPTWPLIAVMTIPMAD